jgi:hypothetical protein
MQYYGCQLAPPLFRGWFYTLLVLSTALFNRPPFKNLVIGFANRTISVKIGNLFCESYDYTEKLVLPINYCNEKRVNLFCPSSNCYDKLCGQIVLPVTRLREKNC